MWCKGSHSSTPSRRTFPVSLKASTVWEKKIYLLNFTVEHNVIYIAYNIPLINLSQPSWLGPLSTSYVLSAYSVAAKGINRESLYAAKLLFTSSQNTDVL